MRSPADSLECAKRVFNTISVLRGQHVTIATVSGDGSPNVAPIGSMRIAGDGTVRVLQGFLPRTMRNLSERPLAAFAVCSRPSLFESLRMFSAREESVLGYRVYGRLVAESDSRDAVAQEVEAILPRIPIFARRAFRRFCEKNLRRLLTFSIDEIREISGRP